MIQLDTNFLVDVTTVGSAGSAKVRGWPELVK